MYADTGVHGAPPSKRFVAGITFSTCVRASKMTRTKKRYCRALLEDSSLISDAQRARSFDHQPSANIGARIHLAG